VVQAEVDFLIAEFDALRREIELKIKEIAQLWRYALFSSGVIWAWLWSPSATVGGHRVVFFLPLVLTLFLVSGNILLRGEIVRTATYILKLEKEVFCKDNGYGWETSLAKDRKESKIWKIWKSKHGQHEWWENLLWLFLCAGNAAIGAIFYNK
jgi:hypothetical protein